MRCCFDTGFLSFPAPEALSLEKHALRALQVKPGFVPSKHGVHHVFPCNCKTALIYGADALIFTDIVLFCQRFICMIRNF